MFSFVMASWHHVLIQYDNYACYVIVKRDSLIFWSAISYDINILCITINYPTTTKMETIS